MDAIAQALESMISNKSNSKSILFASNALQVCLKNYLDYLHKPNKSNSSKMLYGSMMAGKAINIVRQLLHMQYHIHSPRYLILVMGMQFH